MKKSLPLFFAAALLFVVSCGEKDENVGGFEQLAANLTENLQTEEVLTIAVVPFSALEGSATESDAFANYVSEELTTALFIHKKYDIIERSLLDTILEEHELSISGTIDEDTAEELGRLLGVSALCSGTYTDLGDYVKLNARIISTETGRLYSVSSLEVEKDAMMKMLLGETATTSVTTTTTTTTVAGSTASVDSTLSIDDAANIYYSREYEPGSYKTIYVLNNTATRIYYIYCSNVEASEWGMDYLQSDQELMPADALYFTPVYDSRSGMYDLYVELEDGRSAEYYDFKIENFYGFRLVDNNGLRLEPIMVY